LAAVDPDLRFAHELADAADAITLERFRALDLHVDTKPDLTPVSEADRAAEDAVRSLVAARRQGEAVIGEEGGATERDAAARWIVDPIDGTRNYVRGAPVWATLLALERDGRIVCGVASAPALGHRWWATRGGGAFRDGRKLAVSRISSLEEATVSFTRSSFVGATEQTLVLARRAWHMQPFSDFWAHLLVAEGSLEVAFEHVMAPWDNAVLQVIVEEAGGRFTDLSGAARIDGGSAVSTNGLLHDEVLALLRP
jgi:histidinol-phosphatase